MTRRSFQTSDGVTLSLLDAGGEPDRHDAPIIVLVPGWAMPAAIWRGQLEVFGKRYRTFALDPRGQGESQVPAAGITAERRATDLKELLDPLEHVLLVGWSLGALESLQYVHMFGSERLAGMVLIDSSVGEEPAPPSGGTFTSRLREDRDKMLREFVQAIFAKPRTVEEIDDLVQQAKRLPLEAGIALLNSPFERSHWRRIARSFNKPLLYVVTPQFEAQARNLKQNRPATEVVIFRNAGHALFVDEPDRFNALLAKFAERISMRPKEE